MNLDREKFKALVLYVVWRSGQHEGFGITKLNKALWFAEARSFEAYGKPITGETFVRDKHGPRSTTLREICGELEDAGLIDSFSEQVYDFQLHGYRAVSPADTSPFTKEELSLIDWWVANIGAKHTAKSISDLSHDYGWEVAEQGEVLPLHAFLAARIRPPESDEETQWANEEADRLGLK